LGALSQSLSTAANNTAASMGGVAVNYSYEVINKTFTITPSGGGAFTPAAVQTVVSGIQFKTTSTTQGARTITLGYTDTAGNAGDTAVQTLVVDTLAPTLSATTAPKASVTLRPCKGEILRMTSVQDVKATIGALEEETKRVRVDLTTTFEENTVLGKSQAWVQF
jgi:hypothetical protein